jgi:ATP-dependent helicase Lhr and Lhr-like helicase
MSANRSSSFEQLHPTVQEWVWQRGWSELRDAQEQAIPIILSGNQDLIISAATATGKSEAAFLPLTSRLLRDGLRGLILYISPLKALINDQLLRVEDLFGACELPVHPRHGDISSTRKSSFEKDPRGILLITPESLESIFVRRGFYVPVSFKFLTAVVVDELHSFINTERGLQLTSLLCRLEAALGRLVPRIGLSATLGDMNMAADFLRSGESQAVRLVTSTTAGQELQLLIKGYQEPFFDPLQLNGADEDSATSAIARDVFKAVRGSKNLIFANSRKRVEEFTDRLVRLCEVQSYPVEFYAHHGSLSKRHREDVEEILKTPDRPASAICTSTLEMGIDIGQVKSIVQLDPPSRVASLRQRLGRSGRRGDAPILRIFVAEPEARPDLAPQDAIRLDLFQAVTITELLLHNWCEPPTRKRLHLSTLIQQILSLVAQHGGTTAQEAWKKLCRMGPFNNVNSQVFAQVLRSLAAHNILMQSDDGTILHAPLGEQIVNHYSFYTTFWTSQEFQVVHEGTLLGTLPVSHPIPEKSLILFAGRRWRVVRVDEQAKVTFVVPAQGGRAPSFSGGRGHVHRRVHEEMYKLYCESRVPTFLDKGAIALLHEGRECFSTHRLSETHIVPFDGDCLLFLWAGDLVANTLLVQLQALGLSGMSFGVGLLIENIQPEQLSTVLTELATRPAQSPEVLAATVLNRVVDPYDHFLPDELLSLNFASAELDVVQTWNVVQSLGHALTS